MVSQAILQSGSVYAAWAVEAPGNARRKALQMAEFTGCKRPTTEQMLECLQRVDPHEIIRMDDRFRMWWDRDPLVLFRPVIERPGPGAFISDFPYNWDPIRVPTLAGVDEEDGLLRTIYFMLPDYDFDYVSRNLELLLPPSLFYDSPSGTSNIMSSTEKILQFYFGGRRNVTEEDEQVFTDMYSDALFRWPLHRVVENSQTKLYLYVNGFITNYIYFVPNRVSHVQETFFLWEPELMPNKLTDEDLMFSKLVVKWWSNFVIRGNPNEPGVSLWRPSGRNPIQYLHILNNGSRMESGFYEDASIFWSQYSGILDRLRIKPRGFGV